MGQRKLSPPSCWRMTRARLPASNNFCPRAVWSLDRSDLRAAPPHKPSSAMLSGYAGPAACAGCLPGNSKRGARQVWRVCCGRTKPENILGDFSASAQLQRRAPIPSGETAVLTLMSLTIFGKAPAALIDYTIGSKWQQTYATKLCPTAACRFFPFNTIASTKSWVNYWSIIDPPGSARAIITIPKLLPESQIINGTAPYATRPANCERHRLGKMLSHMPRSCSPASIAKCATGHLLCT